VTQSKSIAKTNS